MTRGYYCRNYGLHIPKYIFDLVGLISLMLSSCCCHVCSLTIVTVGEFVGKIGNFFLKYQKLQIFINKIYQLFKFMQIQMISIFIALYLALYLAHYAIDSPGRLGNFIQCLVLHTILLFINRGQLDSKHRLPFIHICSSLTSVEETHPRVWFYIAD